MTGNVNNAIEQIASYFGCTVDKVQEYLPQFIAQQTAGNTFTLILMSVIALVGIIFIIVAIRVFIKQCTEIVEFPIGKTQQKYLAKIKDYNENIEIVCFIVGIIGAAMIIVGTIIAINAAYNVYMWTNFPDVTAIEKIISLITNNNN